MRGWFIVFEGVEGCGKTTQLRHLQIWLQQQLQEQGSSAQVVTTREPGGTALGKEIRQLLLYPTTDELMHDRTELLLYAADRAQHVEHFLKSHLAQGNWVLCDRYTDSTIAYQGYGRQLARALIDQLNAIATGGLQSDLTLWLDVEVEVGLARAQRRGQHDRMEQASLAFHQRVQQGFTELAQAHPDRIVQVDGSGTEAEVAQQIQRILKNYLVQWGMTLQS